MKFYYLVNTKSDWAKITLSRLIPSMLSAGVDKEDILIVSDSEGYFEDMPFIKHSYNAWEFNSILTVHSINIPMDYVFTIMDTSIAGLNFGSKVKQIFSAITNEDLIGFSNGRNIMTCNMGFYSVPFIKNNHNLLFNMFNNISKQQAVETEVNFYLLKTNPVYRIIPCSDNWGNKIDIYGTGTQRYQRYFDAIDLYKYTKCAKAHEVNEDLATVL